MIFYEEVYDKINEDYLNGEISYEMAEAANDLAYNNYITIEEAENAASPQPDQGKVKSLLSKFASKLSALVSKCNVITNALAKFKGKTDSVEKNIGELNANGGKCADGKVENPKRSIKDFVNGTATTFKAIANNKAVVGIGIAVDVGGVAFITYAEYKKHEDAIKAAIKKLQQELVKIANDTAKAIKEYLSITNWKVVAAGAAVGAVAGGSSGIKKSKDIMKRDPNFSFMFNPDKSKTYVDINKDISKLQRKKLIGGSAIGAGVGAGVGLISSVMIQKEIKELEKETGIRAMISEIIATTEAQGKKFGVRFDKSTTTMFAKFKKSK